MREPAGIALSHQGGHVLLLDLCHCYPQQILWVVANGTAKAHPLNPKALLKALPDSPGGKELAADLFNARPMEFCLPVMGPITRLLTAFPKDILSMVLSRENTAPA